MQVRQHRLIFSQGHASPALLEWPLDRAETNLLPSLQLDLRRLAAHQIEWTAAWHDGTTPAPDHPLAHLVAQQHRANFDLWHEEDRARDPAADDAAIATTKRAIDRLNQQRNDLTEQIDAHLLAVLGSQNAAAPLHSETPGMMLDRLSILALKLFHTSLEAHRLTAVPDHRRRNEARAALLETQRTDLAGCLGALLAEVAAGARRFKLYRQLKMYNDPDLNPAIYGRQPTP